MAGIPIFGVNIADIIEQTFVGNIPTATLIKITRGPRDPLNPAAGRPLVPTPHTISAVVEDYEERRVDGTIVERGDRRLIIIAGSLPDGVIPAVNDNVTVEEVTYGIINVERDPAAATYTCQLRR